MFLSVVAGWIKHLFNIPALIKIATNLDYVCLRQL